MALAKTFEAIEDISGRLRMIEVLANFFRSVIVLSPSDLIACVYLSLNQLAPAYEGLELGVAETSLMKVIGQTTGRSMAQIKSDAQSTGDLGIVAERSKSNQRMMFQPAPLTVEGVFMKLKEIARMSGTSVVSCNSLQIFQLEFLPKFIISVDEQEAGQNSINFRRLSSIRGALLHALVAWQAANRFSRAIVVTSIGSSLRSDATRSVREWS